MGLRDYEAVFRAAADPTRVRILKILEGGERTIGPMAICERNMTLPTRRRTVVTR
jgi:DNA-binding transcriptional ArsR family regulator